HCADTRHLTIFIASSRKNATSRCFGVSIATHMNASVHVLATRPVGSVLLFATLIGFGLTLGRLDRLPGGADDRWWQGFVHHGLILLALVASALSLGVGGYPPALALLAGFAVPLGTYISNFVLAQGLGLRRGAGLGASFIGVILALPLVFLPAGVQYAMTRL